MFSQTIFTLVNCLLITLATAIRVDFNTNKGSIVPPVRTTTVRPLLPYREPAPVWEAQSNDIPNPNPYVYILPPPSRPRTNNNNNNNNNNYYGNILLPNAIEAYIENGNGNVVGTLSTKYIPNLGYKYTAVVPSSRGASSYNIINNNNNNNNNSNKNNNNNNNNSGYYNNIENKLQGKYNVKTKKYKAYEKVKYVPINYYPSSFLELALPAAKVYEPVFNQAELLVVQQLPLEQTPPSFRLTPLEAATELQTTEAATTTSAATHVVAPTTATGKAASTIATTAAKIVEHSKLQSQTKSQSKSHLQSQLQVHSKSNSKLTGKSSELTAKRGSAPLPNALHRR